MENKKAARLLSHHLIIIASQNWGAKMPVRSKDGDFPIILDVPFQGVRRTFQELQELLDFLQEEVRAWDAISQHLGNSRLFGIEPSLLVGRKAAGAAARQLASGSDPLSTIQLFDQERPLLMQGVFGQLVADREGETPAQTNGAIWAAASAIGTPKVFSLPNQAASAKDLTAVSYGTVKVANGVSNLKSQKKHVDRLTTELAEHLDAARVNNSETTKGISKTGEQLKAATAKAAHDNEQLLLETHKAVDQSLDRVTKEISAALYEARTNLTEHLRSSSEEIEEFKRKVRIDVGLEEPTNFWTEKANGHRTVAIIFGVLFLGAVLGMVYWIDGYAVNLVSDAVDRIVGDRQAAALSLVPIAFITVPALAFAWVLRHLSRIMIQNLSLEADARLRGTITRTFKALAADRAMNDAELAIALQALFRPIDGKDHSEIAPPSLGDILKLGGDNKI